MASNRHNNWLLEESASWVADGIVSVDQADQLRARYPAAHGISWGLFLLTAIGAIIFGLGIILFFAYNWNELPKYAKLVLIFSALVVAHAIGLVISSRNITNQNLVEGFHVLGTMMFGAGIWLIAQIYHIDEHYPTAFALWGLGALAFAWVLPSVIQGLIATVLLLTWGIAETVGFDSLYLPSLIVLILGVLPLAWHLKSRVLLFSGLCALLGLAFANVLQVFDETIWFFLPFTVATLLICFARLTRYSTFPAGADVLRTIGIAAYGFLLFITTFEDVVEELIDNVPSDGELILSAIMMGLALIGWLALTVHMRMVGITFIKLIELILVFVAIILMSLVLFGVFDGHVAVGVLCMNAVLAIHCVLLIIVGTDELNWRHVAIGCCTLAVLVFWRFNDLFQSLLMRSMVFLVVGAILFFIGHIYAKQSAQKQILRTPTKSILKTAVETQANA